MTHSNADSINASSIGGRIKKIRELRNLTQQELGIKCGFSESTADVRVGQYEANKKAPRPDAIKKLANGLDIDIDALYEADLLKGHTCEHILFDLEEFLGLKPIRLNGKFYLSFSESKPTLQPINNFKHEEFLSKWYTVLEQHLPKINDSEEIIKQKQHDYILWKYEYSRTLSTTNANAMECSSLEECLSTIKILEQRMNEINEQLDLLNGQQNDESKIIEYRELLIEKENLLHRINDLLELGKTLIS